MLFMCAHRNATHTCPYTHKHTHKHADTHTYTHNDSIQPLGNCEGRGEAQPGSQPTNRANKLLSSDTTKPIPKLQPQPHQKFHTNSKQKKDSYATSTLPSTDINHRQPLPATLYHILCTYTSFYRVCLQYLKKKTGTKEGGREGEMPGNCREKHASCMSRRCPRMPGN